MNKRERRVRPVEPRGGRTGTRTSGRVTTRRPRSQGAGETRKVRGRAAGSEDTKESAAFCSDCRLSGKARTGVSFAACTEFRRVPDCGRPVHSPVPPPRREKRSVLRRAETLASDASIARRSQILAPRVENSALAQPLGAPADNSALLRHQVGGAGSALPSAPNHPPSSGQAPSRWVSPNQSPRDFKGRCLAFPLSLFPPSSFT